MSTIRICDVCGRKIENEGYFSIPKRLVDDCPHDVDICVNCMEEIRRKVRKARMESVEQ